MAWIFLAESADSVSHSSHGSGPSPIVNETDTLKAFYCHGCETVHLIEPLSGTTSQHCMESGSQKLTSSSAASLVSHTAAPLEEETDTTRSKRILLESFSRSRQLSFSPRMLGKTQSKIFANHSKKSDTKLRRSQIRLPTWVRHLLGDDTGPLPRPTAKANQHSPSMRKWPSCRRYQKIFGETLNPKAYEYLMGLPIGWTELDASATQWFQSKRVKRSKSYQESEVTR